MFILASLLFILYFAPYVILGEQSYITIHDNLDSLVTYYKVLTDSGCLTGSMNSIIFQFANGLPRNCLPSEFDIISLLYYFLPPYSAYLINWIIISIAGFVGMYLFLKNHILTKYNLSNPINNEFICVGVSLCFALLPYYPLFGLSIAGQPLLFYSFLNIRENKFTILGFLIILLFPFYSHLAIGGIFILIVLAGIFLFDTLNRRFNKSYLLGLFILGCLYVLANYRMFYLTFFNTSFIPHRVEFHTQLISIIQAIKTGLIFFFTGQYHATSLHTPFILLTGLIAAITCFIKNDNDFFTITKLLFVALMIAMFQGIWQWINGAVVSYTNLIVLRTIQIDRFYVFNPIIYYTCFAISLSVIMKYCNKGKYAVAFIIAIQLCFVFTYNNDYRYLVKNKLVELGFVKYSPGITYSAFYSTNLFNKIKKVIKEDPMNCRVLSIGLDPSSSQYNGLYTLDGYFQLYPLEYKHEFRKIMGKELDKNERWKNYYDYWGSRCYVFLSGLSYYRITKYEDNKKIETCDLDFEQIKKMGGKYILSGIDIPNYKNYHLKLLGIFEEDDSVWRIRLYEIE